MMTNNGSFVSKVVESEIAYRAAAARRETEKRREILKARCPEVLALEKEINDTALDFSLKIMQSPSDAPALNALANEVIAGKRTRQRELMTACGLPEDYLASPRFCTECGDTGYVKGSLCRCMRQAVINQSFSGSGIDPNESFDNFRFDILSDKKQQKAVRKIYDYCLRYADSFPDNPQEDILLFGPPGVGKTYLLNCIGGRVLGSGHSVLKITANRLIRTVMDSLHADADERPDYSLPELLIIDDLGTEPMINNITIETLLSIICERQDMHKPVIIATNHDTDQLAGYYGQRIASRLFAPKTVKIIPMENDSVRLMK